MPNSIPNDIYQYNVHSAYTAGLQTGGPPVAFLTNHGTHGFGVFEDGNTMLQLDSSAYKISPQGKVSKASQHNQLPFVMVCVFQPTFRINTPSVTMETVKREMEAQKGGHAAGKNTPMPFAVRGTFKEVKTKEGVFGDVKGTVFGYAIPAWQTGVSGEGLRCGFVSADKTKGGLVEGFEASEGTVVEWAKCGRFHLGFPQDEEFETMSF